MCKIVEGVFYGGEIEEGTFHGGDIEGGTFHGGDIEAGTFHGGGIGPEIFHNDIYPPIGNAYPCDQLPDGCPPVEDPTQEDESDS